MILSLSIMLLLIIILVLYILSMLLSVFLSDMNREQKASFECGFDSKHTGRIPFSFQFGLFVLLFLIFDLELVFFFHFATFLSTGGLSVMMLSLFMLLVFSSFIFEEKELIWLSLVWNF